MTNDRDTSEAVLALSPVFLVLSLTDDDQVDAVFALSPTFLVLSLYGQLVQFIPGRRSTRTSTLPNCVAVV